MNRRSLLVILSVFSVAAWGIAQDEAAVDYLPKKLRLDSNMIKARSLTVTWNGKELSVERSIEGREQPAEIVTPSEKAWHAFWKEIDGIEVWKWKDNYIDPKTVDGHSWSAEIEFGSAKLRTVGSNMYPPQFGRYEKAVLNLIGEKK